jgi:hypothetical protein
MIDLQDAILISETKIPDFKARVVLDCNAYWCIESSKQNQFAGMACVHKKTGELRWGTIPPFDWIENAEEFDPVTVYEV